MDVDEGDAPVRSTGVGRVRRLIKGPPPVRSRGLGFNFKEREQQAFGVF